MRRAPILLLLVALAIGACSGDDHEAASVTTTSSSSTSSSVTTSTTSPVRLVVGGVGDSLLAQVHDALPAALPSFDVDTEGIVGLTANDAMPAVARLLSHGPLAVVVVLGTNDARDGVTSGDDLAAIRQVAEALAGVPCVRWATVNESSRFADMNAGARGINEELRAQAREHANLALIPWGDEVAAHPAWLDPDGIHHSPEGQRAFVERLAAALRACIASI